VRYPDSFAGEHLPEVRVLLMKRDEDDSEPWPGLEESTDREVNFTWESLQKFFVFAKRIAP
jgi:hypothetical protein